MPVSRHLCPVNQGFFCPYRVTAARRFLMRSAACLRVIRFRQSGQYLTLFDFDTKNVPHSVQRFLSSVLKSSAEKLKYIREQLYQDDFHDLLVVDFSDLAQSCKTYDDFTQKMTQVPESALKYFGLAICGSKKKVAKLTGSLPLLR